MNVKSSIHILCLLGTKIKSISDTCSVTLANREYLSEIEYDDDHFNSKPYAYPFSVAGICMNHQIVCCCSFLDEYDKHFTPSYYPEEAERILKFKKMVLPAYKRIKYWKNLKDIRNQIIAHNHRVAGKFIFDYDKKVSYIVPVTLNEYKLLANLIFLIAINIRFVFPEITKEFNINETLLDHLDLISNKTDTFAEFEQIKIEIEDNKNSL